MSISIRKKNFCIIAHIDHGKSTLADRFIQKAKIISDRDFKSQMLDSMEIERERGITIKSQVVTITYKSNDGDCYELNFVDTPGHVDFSYEVSRAISSCEGALLLIDASQGIQAQTVSNFYMAFEHDLEIIPVINKIDLPNANIDFVKKQIKNDLGLNEEIAISISAKNGIGIDDLLEAICKHVPSPRGSIKDPLRALIFDSHYDSYRGVVVHFRIFEGQIKTGDKIRLMHTNSEHLIEEIGVFKISLERKDRLEAGDVGYFIAGIKNISDVKIGDTVTLCDCPALSPLEGFKEVKPVVFSSVYPVDANQYDDLLKAMDRLKLNDASLTFEKDSSSALGHGFKCGFLGLLHLEVIQERIEREFDLNVILTSPSVRYKIIPKKGESYFIESPEQFHGNEAIEGVLEPYIRANIIVPTEFLGNIMSVCLLKRGVQTSLIYLDTKRVELIYKMPLSEILFDFYDKIKSVSRGYASFDYELLDYEYTDLVRLDILVNGDRVDALSQLVFKDSAKTKAIGICKKLKDEIARQQFKIAIQGAIGSNVIARETISPVRKDVTAKCYGGDITRKRKLLEKQKEGKKRMKMVGNVEIPQRAFLAVLKSNDN
ncbi:MULTISPECIES: translation elongation factor 4 [Borreliella]|uniref:Elongation factor 4 n=2 Tax=Borrelia garinii subsp. bavariensis (strain ATCC BAA-2496 / DSM 23469 / PBi) TaxID=290434 RepID=LEPA_BORGP|nr:translation elongation factor 4 [Borreliella bavariensis]Q662S4.1 RecName: Full=Elongation factor 4; Short=EF-4; AltName: Full=Ribosomal back-translocase LepA [Borreliella bavariensis PBi]AAU06947.1 GTP-binding membrane protein [Borreliella bavariensis PBi]AZA27016.1 elongation factor 4 [Borreliella bavariensis PBi]